MKKNIKQNKFYLYSFYYFFCVTLVVIGFSSLSYYFNNFFRIIKVDSSLFSNNDVLCNVEVVEKGRKLIFNGWAINPNQEFKCNSSRILLKKINSTNKDLFYALKTYHLKRDDILLELYNKTGDSKFSSHFKNHYMHMGVNATIKKKYLEEGKYSVYLFFDNCISNSLISLNKVIEL